MKIDTTRSNRAAVGKVFGVAGLVLMAAQNRAQTPALPPIVHVPASVPYTWKNVAIRGGGFVSGLVFSTTQKGLVYARTDVGGAYRSIDSGDHWVPLNDGFGRDDSSFLGIESVALDPEDPNKLYLAEGMYSADWGGPAAIFRSDDQGKTFRKTPMPFKMGGNDNGRGCGEKLAVDPNFGSILYFGSRKAGLWKSSDSGATWSHVDSFPIQAKVTGVGEGTGITFVLFDRSSGAKGSATQSIYVGVAVPGAGLYRSQDAGATWQLVPGEPKDLFPARAAINPGGSIYLAYVDNVGPNDVHDGAVVRFTPADGKWKDVSPLKPGLEGTGKFGYSGIDMDAEHPETLMVTTIDRWWPGDKIFRTTNGGKSWKEVNDTAEFSALTTPWVYWHKDKTGGTGWMSDIKIDPFDSAKVMYTTGEGIWGSANVTALDAGKPTFWGFPNEGLEETVPLGLVSPPEGAHLISVVGDIAGFRHEDLNKSPKDGFFINPQNNTNSSIDFAGLASRIVARVGYGDGKTTRGGFSVDNGVSWKPFATEPPSSKKGGGKIAVSADGHTMVWSPDHGKPYLTADAGRSWIECHGLTDEMVVVSDRVNPDKFYSFNPDSGQFYESLDRGQNFALRAEAVTEKGNYVHMALTPGKEGDLWLAAAKKVYHSADSGVTFVPLAGMYDVYALGFGMAGQGDTYPAIYMNGVVAGVEGIYRSVDAGKNWTRIDDDEHRFGWKNGLIGDPRVFGRVYLATGGRGVVYGDPASRP
jgi:photosystem II stability/assembly factor-like uncharacterized protein